MKKAWLTWDFEVDLDSQPQFHLLQPDERWFQKVVEIVFMEVQHWRLT